MICYNFRLFVAITVIVFYTAACSKEKKKILFTQLSAEQSGVNFSNNITETDSTNSFMNEFGYMGGGVGIGDFNNDGLKDIFFSGNQVSCRAYINKGNNKFEDITEKAGLHTSVWATGVSIVDINNDGYDDVYVCVFGKNLLRRAQNLLFINQHDLTFKEEAAEYGLADTSYSTQAVFLDYDRDGDLDMYLVNYLLNGPNANFIVPRDRSGHSPANDRLFRNDGKPAGKNHPVFSDVTIQAGILDDGYGLGVSVSDFNNDGWPDIYVANDFLSNDALWLNNRNGTFTNCISKALQHQSYSSMGSDAADINNDGLADIVTLDMLPEYNERKKTSFFFMNYERYQSERALGYEPEFARNMLQLNNGNYNAGDTAIPFFSEIGQQAGIAATDWSWSVLLADFNNDGWKDMHVTNGIGRDFINADFLEFSNEIAAVFQDREQSQKEIRKKLASLKHVELSNYLFINKKNYSFADSAEKDGIGEPGMSNGAAYADLDNDGDLDLVVNNINKKAFVFINNTLQKDEPAASHYLGVQLKGDSLNKNGFGTRITIYTNGKLQVQEQNPVRGYFSSVDQKLLFGLGDDKQIDSLLVQWPDGKRQMIANIPADTTVILSMANAITAAAPQPAAIQHLFSDITSVAGVQYRHQDNIFNDFAIQRLLPHKYSQLGPFISTGDINNDGKTDFFVGGGAGSPGMLFTQQNDQTFTSKKLADSLEHGDDMDCILFDADNDRDEDLLVTGGDIQYEEHPEYYKPRLYINDGKGNFSLNPAAFADSIRTIAGCVVAGDYDGDGDLDIFIGGRVSQKYPQTPRSYLLQNNGGIFSDVTATVNPSLQYTGMITSAVWTDFDNDRRPDLVVAGEWMPIRFFKNTKGRLEEVTGSTGLQNMNGMWKSLIATDLDKDGDMDLVAGNLGLNCIYNVTPDDPMELYAADIDGNGSIDPVLFYYIKDKTGKRQLHPGISRSQFSDQVPAVKKQFLYATDYAKATVDDIYKDKKGSLLNFSCNETRSCWFENDGKGKFIKHILPQEAQFAPINAILCEDFDNDGINDLLLAGNDYQSDVITGRYDASYGCYLRGGSQKTFRAVAPVASGFILKGDVKDLSFIREAGGRKIVVAAVNNDSLKVYRAGPGY